MKIAILNIYNGIVERGSEIFVKELATRLSANHEVCVYQVGERDNEKYGIQKISGIPYKPHQIDIKLLFWPSRLIYVQIYYFWVLIFTLKCFFYLWREKYDWIIPINGRFQVVICRLVRLFRGGKILISGHAGVGFEDRVNIIFGKPDVFIALTPTAFSWAKKIWPKGNIRYIPNGVDIQKFNPDILPQKLSLKKPIILCVSALLPYKRIDLLIKAVSQVGDASLLIIGDGPLKKEIINLGKELLKDRFLLLSSVAHSKIAAYYSLAQVFSLPSWENEAFGLVYLEAMACNKPIVAPDDENRREIIGNAGIFCDPANREEYTFTLQNALTTDFGDKPRRQAEKFSWGAIAEKYEEVMEEFKFHGRY